MLRSSLHIVNTLSSEGQASAPLWSSLTFDPINGVDDALDLGHVG